MSDTININDLEPVLITAPSTPPIPASTPPPGPPLSPPAPVNDAVDNQSPLETCAVPSPMINIESPRQRFPYQASNFGPRGSPSSRFRGFIRGARPPMPGLPMAPHPYSLRPMQQRMGKDGLNSNTGPALPPVPPGIKNDLWEWFFNADEDKDGCITAAEVQRILLNGNWRPFNEETCKMMVYMMDVEKTGNLDAYELTTLWEYLTKWKDVFDSMDEEKNGSLKACNIFKALEVLGYRLSSEFCDAVITRFDENGDGTLSFDDFIQTCIMLRSLTEAFKIQDTNQEGVINLHFEQFLEMVLDNAIGFTKSSTPLSS